ncbi:MAG TPA: lysoplasmalogenase [Bacteroidales bacterium]|nr:lysoplasmalogenase [Bacteroidales bacterium]
MKTRILSAIYFAVSLLFIFVSMQAGKNTAIINKALIMPSLAVLFLLNMKRPPGRQDYMIIAGLFFSWAGDIFLELPDSEVMFVPGLASFLLAHVMYLTVFFSTEGKNTISLRKPVLILPVLTYGAALVAYLYKYLGDMRLPVIVYAVVILTMLTGAINRYHKVSIISYLLVLSGAILFVLSDSMIAINKFAIAIPSARIFIMITYVTAQYLIITGYLRQSGDIR